MGRKKQIEETAGGAAVMDEAPPETPAAEASEPVQASAQMPAERYEPALSIELLTASKSNPRKTFKPEYLAQLAENLKARGQIHPILVRPVDVSGDVVNQYEIVVGECRYRAAKLAGLPTLMATVRELSDVDVLKIQLDENAKRQDITPLEEAAAYQDLMKKAKWDAKQLADDQKVSVRQVYARLALLKLPKAVAKALSEGRITAEHAAVIASLKTPELQEDALDAASTQSYVHGAGEDPIAIVPIRDFKLYVKRDLLRDLNAAPWDKHDTELVKGAPACEGCQFRSSCNPDLFAEDDEDVCHDSECFNKKMEAHLRGRQTELKSEGKEAVLVSHSWGSEVKGSVSKNRWEESKAKDAVVGILVDGPDRGKEIRVKVAKASSNGNGYTAPTKEEREAEAERQRKADEKRKVDAKIAARVFMGLARNIPKELDLATLRSLVRDNAVDFTDVEKQDQDALKKITGVKSRYHLSEKDCANLSEAQCITNLYLSTFSRFLGEYSDNRGPLFAAAKKAGIDVDAVRAKLKADEAGVPVEKPKTTKAVIRNVETGELAPLRGKLPTGWERGYVDQDGDYHKGDEPTKKKSSDKISAKQIKKNVAAAKKKKTPKGKKAKAKKK